MIRTPNRLKFRMVYSDKSLIEGTVICSDQQGADIMRVLWPACDGRDEGIEQAFARQQNKDQP